MVEDADESALPPMDVVPDHQRHLGIGERSEADHVLYGLSDIELRILFGPGVNVVQSPVAVCYPQTLLRHHCEDVRKVVAVQLIKFNRCRGYRVGHAKWQT